MTLGDDNVGVTLRVDSVVMLGGDIVGLMLVGDVGMTGG